MSNHTIAAHFETWIAEQIRAGRYGSETEVIEEALRRMERQEAKHQALRAAIQEGIDSGPSQPLDIERLIREARAEREARQLAKT